MKCIQLRKVTFIKKSKYMSVSEIKDIILETFLIFGSDFRLYDGSDLKTYLLIGCLSGPPGFTCWISFAPGFSLIYC